MADYSSREDRDRDSASDQSVILRQILDELRLHTSILDELACCACAAADEACRHRRLLEAQKASLRDLVDLYRRSHPDHALQIDELAKLRAEVHRCCPDEDDGGGRHPCRCGEPHHHGDGVVIDADGRRSRGDRDRSAVGLSDGWSAKSRAEVEPVPFTEKPHDRWKIGTRIPNSGVESPPIAQGPVRGRTQPVASTPLRTYSGTGSTGGQSPINFREYTRTELSGGWPPDMSGARAGDVVLMSGNLWLKLSVDGGKTFDDLDFTTIFAADKTYGGWAGDQVIHYVPSIDAFVLYVQSFTSKTQVNRNIVKVALASPADLKLHKGGRLAWRRQWDFTSDTFGLGDRWFDFPDLTWDSSYLYVNTNVAVGRDVVGKLFFELPLADLKAGRSLSFLFAFIDEKINIGSPAQNIDGENYWAAHVNNTTLRIYSSKGSDANYYWRDKGVTAWPKVDDIVSKPPDFSDWISEDHRIIGATKVGNILWFAWSAGKGDGGHGGFSFPQPHVRIVQVDVGQDYKVVGEMQIWNADYAFAYPSLMTNSDGEVGISLGWGGGNKYFGSHAVGFWGDYELWYQDGSQVTSERQEQDKDGNLVKNADGTPKMYSRWGDYVHVRRATPDNRYLGAFGYAVLSDPTATPAERFEFLYVEFGRPSSNAPAAPVIR